MKTIGDWVTLLWVSLMVIAIVIFGWWLTTILSFWTIYYITIVLNFIVMTYVGIEFGNKK